MILSAKLRRSRIARRCSACSITIDPGTYYAAVFGMAERGDRPGSIAKCSWCTARSLDVRSALSPRDFLALLALHPEEAARETWRTAP